MTENNRNVMLRDYLFSLLLPGLGHIARGWWRKGLLFWVFLGIQSGILYLAVLRGRLAWLACSASKRPSQYWFSTILLLLFFVVLWLWAFLDLHRLIRASKVETFVQGYRQIVARRFSKDLKGLVGLGIILIVFYVAIFAPFIARGNALSMDLVNFLDRPSAEHPLGLDNFGRDVMDRMIFGSRVALGIGAGATLLNMVFGGFLGLIAGYFRAVPDSVIMRLLEIVNSIPFLVLALLIVSLWEAGVLTLIIVLGIFGLQPARIIRDRKSTV